MSTKTMIQVVSSEGTGSEFVAASFEACAAFVTDGDGGHVCAGCGWLAEEHAAPQPVAA